MGKYRYQFCCVNAPNVRELIKTIDRERSITRKTFLKWIDKNDLAGLSQEMGYSEHWKQGLTMAADWHISYHKSRYKGKTCYYLKWSGIEYLFL